MKKKAEQLKKGDNLLLLEKIVVVEATEVSDIGKPGVKKCRLELKTDDGAKIIVVRPADYPFEAL